MWSLLVFIVVVLVVGVVALEALSQYWETQRTRIISNSEIEVARIIVKTQTIYSVQAQRD